MSEADIAKVVSKFDKISAGKKSIDEVGPILDYLESLEISREILTVIYLLLN